MTLRLKISLAANGVLALLVVWLLHARSDAMAYKSAVLQEMPAQPEAQAAATTAEKSQPAAPAPFRWNQLVAPDYRIFIKNLRDIGCPEDDIRAIVTVDTDQAFAFKRRELNVDDRSTEPWSWQSEQRLIASLLGEQLAAEPAPAPAPAPMAQWTPKALPHPDADPALPLIFQPIDSERLNLTDTQKQVIEQLQKQFLDAIGGPNQDPNDPAYLARWQAAQPKIDQSLKGLLGSQFYIKFQLMASGYPVSQ